MAPDCPLARVGFHQDSEVLDLLEIPIALLVSEDVCNSIDQNLDLDGQSNPPGVVEVNAGKVVSGVGSIEVQVRLFHY